MKRLLTTVLAMALLVGGRRNTARSDEDPPSAASRTPTLITSVELSQCLVSPIDDVQVAALEASQLKEIRVREGAEVKRGDLLALLDDVRPRLQQEIAKRQHDLAAIHAKNDVNLRFAKAQSDVTQAEYEEALEANKLSAGAVAAAEVRRLLLTARRARLAIEQASVEQQVAVATEKVREAELRAAIHDVERRRITAPSEGVVVEIFKRPGEWVQAGDRVLRLVTMHHLRVEGFVNAREFGDEEIVDCTVRLRVDRQRQASEEFSGRIVFVSPQIEASGNYRVFAEIENRQANGRWLLRPGMDVQLKMRLKKPVRAAADAP